MDITITFPGGKRVDAHAGEFTIRTDQPTKLGGDNTAPSPFDLFLASIGTCAGIYVLGFCHARDLSTEGLALRQHVEFDPKTKLATDIELELTLPENFPEEYHAAVVRAAEHCKVKQTLLNPPSIRVRLNSGSAENEEEKSHVSSHPL